MNKYDLLFNYFKKNYLLDNLGPELLLNIIHHAIDNAESPEKTNELLYCLLDGIGLEEGEIEMVLKAEGKPYSLIKATATFDRYDIPKVRESGKVFEATDSKKEFVKAFDTLEEARKELDKHNTTYYAKDKNSKTITTTEYCIEEEGEKIAFSEKVFTGFVAFETENGLKTLTKRFPSSDFGVHAYDCCQEWAEETSNYFGSVLHVGVEEYGVKYIDGILMVEEYMKLYDFFYLLNCDGFYIKKSLDKNNKEYFEISVRNSDSFKYFDMPILNDGEFAGLELNHQYDQYDLGLQVDYREDFD